MTFANLSPMDRRNALLDLLGRPGATWLELANERTKQRVEQIRATDLSCVFWVQMVAEAIPGLLTALDAWVYPADGLTSDRGPAGSLDHLATPSASADQQNWSLPRETESEVMAREEREARVTAGLDEPSNGDWTRRRDLE